MSAQLKEVLYTADSVVEGGRKGDGRTSDRRLEVDLSVPATMSGDDGPGTNPEQLFDIGYAACFESALLGVAEGRNLDASGIANQVTRRHRPARLRRLRAPGLTRPARTDHRRG